MSTKVDVLAVLDSVIQRSGHIVACDVVQARAAIAELIAADQEYDRRFQALGNAELLGQGFRVTTKEFEAARERRAAALAAATAQSAGSVTGEVQG